MTYSPRTRHDTIHCIAKMNIRVNTRWLIDWRLIWRVILYTWLWCFLFSHRNLSLSNRLRHKFRVRWNFSSEFHSIFAISVIFTLTLSYSLYLLLLLSNAFIILWMPLKCSGENDWWTTFRRYRSMHCIANIEAEKKNNPINKKSKWNEIYQTNPNEN